MKPFRDNHIITGLLSTDQYEAIYRIIDAADLKNTTVVERMGHRAYLVSLGQGVRNTLERRVQDIYGTDWVLKDYQFARYTKKWGYETKLYPHIDDAFDDHRITLDVQLRSTIAWPIVVEGREFTLNDNEGLFFSGTDQTHWRKKIDLDKDDVVDMIFCHFSNPSHPETKISDEWRIQREVVQKYWTKEANISNEIVKLEEIISGA
jgi:hypothetical protein